MKNFYANKILPLTIKQLKKAEYQYQSRKSQVYDSASWDYIVIVARIVLNNSTDFKFTDSTDFLQLPMYPGSALKKGVDPIAGNYYKFYIAPRGNALKSNMMANFALQIVGITNVSYNEITTHLINCMKQKMSRQQFKKKNKIIDQGINKGQKMQIQENITKSVQNNNAGKLNNTGSGQNNKVIKGQEEITKYVKELGRQFDSQTIQSNFGQKYSSKDIQKVLQILSQKGLIMDLGLVYQWAGSQQ